MLLVAAAGTVAVAAAAAMASQDWTREYPKVALMGHALMHDVSASACTSHFHIHTDLGAELNPESLCPPTSNPLH